MSWTKVLLVVILLGVGIVLLAAASVGFAVTAGIVAAVEHGVVDTVAETVSEAAEEVDGVEVNVDVPRITITDPDTGRVRVLVPRLDGRIGRIVVDGRDYGRFWPAVVLSPLAAFFRGLTTILAIGLVVTGAWLLLRNRQPVGKMPKSE